MAFQAPKKVPKWALYAGGGAVVVGGVLYLKNKNAPSSSSSATDTADTSGMTGFTDGQNMPGIVVAPSSPPDLSGLQPPDESAILSSIADIIGSLLPGGIPVGGGGGSVAGTGNTGGVVTAGGGGPIPSPAPAPSPPPVPTVSRCAGMQSGGSAGSCHPAGAICRQMLKCDSNANGHYCTWKFKFADGHTNCYNHYSSGKKAGQCVGPFGCP